MIILDANILKSTSLRSTVADVLRAIRASGEERVATPWIAVEEVAAQQALSYQAKHAAALAAVEELRKATPWKHVDHPRKWPAEHVREHWRERYASITEVIETPPAAYQQAMFRETNLIAPCKTVNSGRHKTGARDAAIWLTAVEYARDHPDETVYFVSNNTEDFGDGTSFPHPMDRDIRDVEGRFFLFTSLDGVLKKFAKEVEATAQDVQGLLDTEEAHAAILEAARAARKRFHAFPGSALTMASEGDFYKLNPVTVRRWDPTAAALGQVTEVSGREVGDHHWFTATVRWLLREPVGFGNDERDHAFAWETRVLLSTAADKAITVLDSKRPTAITSDDIPRLPEISYVDAELRLAEAQVRSWPTVLLCDLPWLTSRT
ncbi:PIN domain-containing protein [Streptomyces sp. NPDC004667]|uniref:PIN domain-containing protein n=1 Tax=Streptomyces sp. NPDC004667 TaxID=3154285 RepID=UPI0033AB3EA3